MGDAGFSRGELLWGGLNRSRRATKLLAAIEARCTYMRDESRRVVAAYLLGTGENFRRRFDDNYIRSLKLTAESADTLLLDHLERFASQWNTLVPADPELRARILRLIRQKYGLGPSTLAALGSTQEEVQAAYQQLFGERLEDLSRGWAGGPAASAPTPSGAWQDFEARLEWLNLPGGETLFRAGDPGDALYVVVSGRMRAIVEEDGGEHTVNEMGRGELVGELAVLTGDPRSTTVRAARDSELIRLRRDDLMKLAQQHLEVMVRVSALIARRLQKQLAHTGRAENTLLTYTLLPCDASVPVAEFGRQLVQALAEFGPATYVTCPRVDEAIESGAAQATLDDPRNAQIVSWLSELESRYRYVVYEAEPEASEWSRRCLRQADRILLVGRAGAPPLPAAHEEALLATEPGGGPGSYGVPRPRVRSCGTQRSNRVELILLHDPDTASPLATARWLAPRSLRSHYHVRVGDPRDIAYLARCLTGHALGLVLGGGGARGFAHVGVLRALEEAGKAVDLVGGTSMGALIAGAVALGMDSRQIREIAVNVSSPLQLFDPTLPVVSLFAGGKVTSIFRKIYGDALMEDLWRPAFCVSSNLTHSCETVYRQGPLWKAVRASMAIPGIFAPVLRDGDLQVDGAVVNNVPIDVMSEFGVAGTLIGVNVMPLDDLVREYRFGDSISGTRAALSMINPFDGMSVPMIYGTLLRVMALHEVHQEQAKRRLADIYLAPAVEKYDILDFGSYDPIIEIGYQAALEAFAAANWQLHEPAKKPVTPAAAAVSVGPLQKTLADLETILDDLQRPR